jgi:hypothetical protein
MIFINDFAEFLDVVLTGIFGDPFVGGIHLGTERRQIGTRDLLPEDRLLFRRQPLPASYVSGSTLFVDGGWTGIDGPPTDLTQLAK